MKKQRDNKHGASRREFLQGAAAAGVGAALGTALPDAAPTDVAQAPRAVGDGQGYRLSAHVQRYYDTLRR